MIIPLPWVAFHAEPTSVAEFCQAISSDLNTGAFDDIKSYFLDKQDSQYLFDMKAFRPKLSVYVIPRPPGYQHGMYWIVFSTWQNVEMTADAVYRVYMVDGKFKIGKEVGEDDLSGWRVKSVNYSAGLHPEKKSVTVDAKLSLEGSANRALAFRLNNGIQLLSDAKHRVVVIKPNSYLVPKDGDLVRAGGLLIPWTDQPSHQYEFRYEVTPPAGAEDSIDADHAYVTALWIPSLGRLPAPVDATVTGPESWQIRGEGNLVSRKVTGGSQTVEFSCPLPISFPKIIGGKYELMATKKVGDELFNVWQVAPTDKAQAAKDLKDMVRGATYYQSILGPLPFKGYELYDSKDYYGIESYSHTLLQKGATHFVTHEMGHSYFGGYAPDTYIHDAWNEGLTEYLDSVLLNHDADHTLEGAFASINDLIPLNAIRICWANNNAAYMRGAYVMQMLDWVIGKDAVIAGMKAIVQDRVGKDTRWDDLRTYFEKSSGQTLDWFWNQWIDNGKFPSLKILSTKTTGKASSYQTKVVVEQAGSDLPFRLKFKVHLAGPGGVSDKVVDMTAPQQEFAITTDFKPDQATLDIFGLSFVHVLDTKN